MRLLLAAAAALLACGVCLAGDAIGGPPDSTKQPEATPYVVYVPSLNYIPEQTCLVEAYLCDPVILPASFSEVPEPEPEPEFTVVAAEALPSWSLTEGEMREVLALAGWPEELFEQALAVAKCESGWSPAARNRYNPTVYGLFQLQQLSGWGWFSVFGFDPELWYDPVVNAATAWRVYQYDLEAGHPAWSQWECKP